MTTQQVLNDFSHTYTDLLSERYGGQVLGCNDEFFADASHLMKVNEPVFIEGKYTDRGKWMDGWETRRRRSEGFDWCILRLGISGIIHGIDVNTTHFKGNAPASVAIEACYSQKDPDETTDWQPLLIQTSINADSHNVFAIDNKTAWTHLRLRIFPDGGVARLRVYGVGMFDRSLLLPNELIDLAACIHGGRAVACSDMFFSPMNNLIAPERGINMGDGWETKRRRGEGYDWNIIQLACTGKIARLVIDTCHFKGNYPDRCSIEAINLTGDILDESLEWTTILPKTPLYAHREHIFQKELLNTENNFTHVRLNIFPDGGVSRLRVWGYPSEDNA